MVTFSFSKAIVEELKKELIRAHELNNLRLYKLTQGLLWIDQGKSWKEIAELLRVSVKTVVNWLKRFLVQGLGWLRGQHYRGRGRKAKLTSEQKRQVRAWVEAGPEANGFDCGVWNTAMIAELIWRRLGVRYHPRYLSTLLKKLGLSYQKARFISDRSDEEAYEPVKQFTAAHAQRLSIESLPAFSPEYNPIEKLWRNTKKQATYLKYFKTFDELRASVLNVFRKYLDKTLGK